MNNLSNILPMQPTTKYFGAAKVLAPESGDGRVKVLWEQLDRQLTLNAIIAIQRNKALKPGNQVLIAGESEHQLFVIGILGGPVKLPSSGKEIFTAKGVSARISEDVDVETLNVYSEKQELLFSYDSSSETTTLNIPKGNLQINSEEGGIDLRAAKAVNINGQSVKLQSQKLSIHAPYAQFVFGRVESVADTIIEGAKNVYRNVKELTQIRTGRMRHFVEETYQFKSKKANIRADEDYKVDAEKIHLG